MREEKQKILSKMTKDQLLTLNKNNFTKSEIIEILNETRLNNLDNKIANLYLLECYNFELISQELRIDKRTVKKHWQNISYRLKETLIKMFYTKKDIFKK